MKFGNFSGMNNSLCGGLSGQSAVYSTVAGRLWTPSTWKLSSRATTTGTFGSGVSETAPAALFWNATGTVVYWSGASQQIKSSTGTAFDVTGRTGTASSFVLKAVDGITNVTPSGMALSANGLNLFTIDQVGKLFKHTLATAFLLTSIVTTAAQENALNFATATLPRGLSFIENGGNCKLMFCNSGTSQAIQVYSMNAAFDLTTCLQTSTVATPISTPQGCCWMDSGNKMAIVSANTIRCYVTGSPYTVPALTASSHYDTLDTSSFGLTAVTDIQFDTNGTRLFVTDSTSDTITQLIL